MPLYAIAEPPSACSACAPCHPDICTAQIHAISSPGRENVFGSKGEVPLKTIALYALASGIPCNQQRQLVTSHGKADKIKACAWPDQASQDIAVLPLPSMLSSCDVLCFADTGLHSQSERSANAVHLSYTASCHHTCIRRLTTSRGYATVCPVVPAMAPHASRASVLSSLSSFNSACSTHSASGSLADRYHRTHP